MNDLSKTESMRKLMETFNINEKYEEITGPMSGGERSMFQNTMSGIRDLSQKLEKIIIKTADRKLKVKMDAFHEDLRKVWMANKNRK